MIKIDKKDIPAELKEKLKPGKDGLLSLSYEELENELSGKVKKVEVLYEKEK